MRVFGTSVQGKLIAPKATSSWKIGEMLKKGQYNNIAVLSFSSVDVESIDIRRCFDETNHLFSFGRDVMKSVVTLDMVLFLGQICTKKGGVGTLSISQLKTLYSKNRVSQKKEGLSSNVDDFTFKGYLVGMTIGSVDPSRQYCVVSFSFIPIQGR